MARFEFGYDHFNGFFLCFSGTSACCSVKPAMRNLFEYTSVSKVADRTEGATTLGRHNDAK